MEEFEDDDIDLKRKIDELQELFFETIYKEICLGGKVNKNDLEEAILYFANKEEYEKCIILKKKL
ncbi:MAG: hypothetical protein HPY57_14820 [Ignavibacteria bacterium]|nr:hypothetical protein [Ignavibacteria bacterium]